MNGLPNKENRTIQENIDRLECLFKSYKNDSEFNYQLEVKNSPFNEIKEYIQKQEKLLNILKEKTVHLETIQGDIYHNKTIEYMVEHYRDLYFSDLTEEEMELIVDWLMEEK